jgi:hypothetical protein
MHQADFQRLEGVWNGTESTNDAGTEHEATARLVFQTIFDGRLLLCDYVQTAPDRPISVGHGVFRRHEPTDVLTVTWFRIPEATAVQQTHGIAEHDKLIFIETIASRRTRTTYSLALNRLSILTESSLSSGEWKQVCAGAYRRR